MPRISRFTSAVAAIAAGGLMLVGCSTAGASTDEKSLNYESYWTAGEPTSDILLQAIADFEEETGITVNVKWKGRDLPATLAPLLSSSQPKVDLVDFGCDASRANLYSTDHATDLSSVLKATVPGESVTAGEVISDDVLAIGQDGDDTFCIPYEALSSTDFWFNAAEFPELTDAPPADWKEFRSILDAAGKGSLALDGTIAPYAASYFINFVVSAGGKNAYLNAASDKTGKEFVDNPIFLEAAQQVEELVDAGYFPAGYDSSKFPAMQQKWANNDSGFILVGSWLPAEVAPYAAPGFEYSSFPFPAIEAGADRPMALNSIGFSVLKGAPNADNAQKFIEFFLQKKYQDALGEIALPARTDATVNSTLTNVQEALNDPEILKIQVQDGAVGTVGGWTTDVGDAYAQKLTLGQLRAEEFITQISTASADYWANQQ